MRLSGQAHHLLGGAERDAVRRARLGAGRLLAYGHPVGAQRALVRRVVDLGDARDVERASLHAVAAADAVLVDEIHDPVGVLHDGAGRRAGLEAARVLAVHAPILADEPLEIARLWVVPLREAHQREHVGRQVVGVVVDPLVDPDRLTHVVPFQTRRLAGLAADALRRVDQLHHLHAPVGGGGGRHRGRAADDVEWLKRCHGSSSPMPPVR